MTHFFKSSKNTQKCWVGKIDSLNSQDLLEQFFALPPGGAGKCFSHLTVILMWAFPHPFPIFPLFNLSLVFS